MIYFGQAYGQPKTYIHRNAGTQSSESLNRELVRNTVVEVAMARKSVIKNGVQPEISLM